MSSIRRDFSTKARALLKFIWKGTGSNSQSEDRIKARFAKNPKLVDADRVEIAGDEHTLPADHKPRVSGQALKDNRRLTSLHAYHDGTIIYSKDSINKAQED